MIQKILDDGCNTAYRNFTLENYYIKGCVSGMSGIILSHPVDSIKTHLQMSTTTSTKFNPTFKNLYRGITSPLIGVGIEKAIVFGTYNYCKNNMNYNIPISGAISGLTASLIVSPYERIKIMKQTNQKIAVKQYFNPNFIFKGLSATFTREVPGFAIYFSTYEGLKNHFYKNRDISIIASFIFGGMSGTMAWIFIYPQDRIKTIIQSNTNTHNNINLLIKNIYNNGGFKQFYKGFSFAVFRAILLHSGTFSMMEILNKQSLHNIFSLY
jgi:solute carrier family 25 carnitine/acylcarnitine transporter 20/29